MCCTILFLPGDRISACGTAFGRSSVLDSLECPFGFVNDVKSQGGCSFGSTRNDGYMLQRIVYTFTGFT